VRSPATTLTCAAIKNTAGDCQSKHRSAGKKRWPSRRTVSPTASLRTSTWQQASTVLATTRADVPTLESAIQIATHRVEVLIGQQPGMLQTELAAVAPIPAQPPQVPVGLPSELLLRRPDVSRAERQLAAATANIGVAKSDLFPKFYLTGSLGSESISASDWFTSGSRSGRLARPCNGGFLTRVASARTSRFKMRGRSKRWPPTNKPC